MSHQPQRNEKDCLNCGTTVAGKFCQHCGQENTVSHMHFFALTRHFIYDIFHFDGKFFDTLRYLFFKPAFVASEYVAGRRMRYLDPIRMYLFTSAFFFLLFFSFANTSDISSTDDERYLNRSQRLGLAMELNARGALTRGDSTEQHALALLLDSTQQLRLLPADSAAAGEAPIRFAHQTYVLRHEADSMGYINFRGGDGWLSKRIGSKLKTLEQRYRDNPKEGVSEYLDLFLHRLPYLLFLSLPFFALILKLLYLRRKRFYFFDHAIFTLYHYVFSFMLLLVVAGVVALDRKLGWGILGFFTGVLIFSWPLHLYLGMKRFYGQGAALTFGKFVLLNLLGLLVLVLLFLGFLLFSIFSL